MEYDRALTLKVNLPPSLPLSGVEPEWTPEAWQVSLEGERAGCTRAPPDHLRVLIVNFDVSR